MTARSPIAPLVEARRRSVLDGIVEHEEYGAIVLSPAKAARVRRVVYLDNYGGRAMWQKIKQGEVPPHHLRGCLELARMGYEVALAEPIPDFNRRRPFPHDLKLVRIIKRWLGRDGIVYCGHNVLYWVPFLKSVGLIRCHVISHLWACEPLDQCKGQSGIIALTPIGAEQARKLAPNAKVAHLGWGAHLDSFPVLPYRPDWLLHCGIAGRDFATLSRAASISGSPLRVICAWVPEGLSWPANVELVDGGRALNFQEKKVSFDDLIYTHYAGSAASLIINVPDPKRENAFGFTNLIEALAMGQPVILTRSGALPSEIDVEAEGCGLFVPPEDPEALANAMEAIMTDPARAEAMGRAARALCESRYNINRYAAELHRFFETL